MKEYTGRNIVYAQEKQLIPTPPSIFVSGMRNIAPSSFAAAADTMSISEPFRKSCLFICPPPYPVIYATYAHPPIYLLYKKYMLQKLRLCVIMIYV